MKSIVRIASPLLAFALVAGIALVAEAQTRRTRTQPNAEVAPAETTTTERTAEGSGDDLSSTSRSVAPITTTDPQSQPDPASDGASTDDGCESCGASTDD